ncbi:putative F-box/LRR-repeat protein [Citrus sinensis]|nr:putative F-box/LRR-repeat protein [Citrus sinensis]
MDETVDCISDLPIFIIHHIMSFLSAKEAARTSILSKRWRQFQSSFPIFDFIQHNFRGLEDTSPYTLIFLRENRKFRRSLKRFIRVVDRSLSRFCKLNLSMQELRICISVIDLQRSPPLFDKWIRLALENGLKDLDFEIISDEENNEVFTYTLPQTIFSANLLTSLRLGGCKFEQPSYAMSFHSLKELCLDRIYLNDQMVQKLISECHLLEDLWLENCSGLKFLCICEAHKLKILTIRSESIELESINIVVPGLQQLSLIFTLSWGGPRVVDVAACPLLEKLYLTSFKLKDEEFHNFISKFPLLKDLLLCGCLLLERIKISSNQLKYLSIKSCANLKAIDRNPFPIISINSRCPWKKIEFTCRDDLDGCWFLNLKEFLGLSNQIDDLTLELRLSQSLFNLYELSRCFNSLPVGVGSLMLWMDLSDVSPSEYEIVLDGIFWICYPRTLCLSTTYEEQHPFIVECLFYAFVYDELKNSNSDDIKSWRYYLMDAKIESFKHFRGLMLNSDQLNQFMDEWPKFPDGFLRLHLDWCFSE